MKTIYLYIKTSPLGLKYLGKTVKDPFKYTGSGTRWLLHLKAHNFQIKDLKTEIIFETANITELREKGLYYSDIWNIVESDEWANLVPESGEGFFGYHHSEETLQKLRNRVCSEETKDKLRKANIGKKYPRETKLKLSKQVVHKETGQIYDSIRDAAKLTGINERKLYQRLLNNYICEFEFLDKSLNKPIIDNLRTKVRHKETGEIFRSITEAAAIYNINMGSLKSAIRRNSKGCKFEYLKAEK